MGEKFLGYPDYLLDISNGKYDEATHTEFADWAAELTYEAPADARDIVTRYLDPIYQVQEVVDMGGGELEFSTTGFKEGSIELLEYCVDAGFRVDE